MSENKIAIIGLGYVGLPLAIEFAKVYQGTVGFDINQQRIEQLISGVDISGETSEAELRTTSATFTSDTEKLKGQNFFIIGVPTPVDRNHNPDLTALINASEIVGKSLSPGSIVVYESTVYPSVTEEICGPILAQSSGLRLGIDFKLGYSPERINPGDKEHTLKTVIKIVAGQDAQALERVYEAYSKIVDAGLCRVSCIQVAEAAKVIENTQRDLNIALMNELAIIFDRIGISTKEVIDAAGTQWNFLRFSPGLVGGHCIGVDPYYLTTKAEQIGYHPEVILAGRRINDSMGVFVANKTIKLMIQAGIQIKNARIGILGATFKENVADIRNSRVPDIVNELRLYGIDPLLHDPLVDAEYLQHETGIPMVQWKDLFSLDAVILAVPHQYYLRMGVEQLSGLIKHRGVFVDVKSAFDSVKAREDLIYWSL